MRHSILAESPPHQCHEVYKSIMESHTHFMDNKRLKKCAPHMENDPEIKKLLSITALLNVGGRTPRTSMLIRLVLLGQ